MTRKPRRLHSVPTGDDVDRPLVDHAAATEPDAIPDWPFPLVDLSSLTPTDVESLMDRIGEFSRNGQHHHRTAPTRRRPRRKVSVTLRVRVEITGIDPPIWRTLDLDSSLTLEQLHPILQSAFGWLDMHLHTFVSGDGNQDPAAERYLTPFDIAEGENGVLESAVELSEVLADPGDTLFYTYDFGDHWEHVLVLESVERRSSGDVPARCVSGGRAGAPEDCGGVWGYQDLLDDGLLVGDPEAFDLAAINAGLERVRQMRTDPHGVARAVPDQLPTAVAELLARSVGSQAATLPDLLAGIDFDSSISLPAAAAEVLTRPYVWLLKRVGPAGLAVTGAGYLKPADVSDALTVLFPDGGWPGAGNREAHALPARWLRLNAQRFGLVRKSGGRLVLTRVGSSLMDDPSALLDRIAGRLPLGNNPHERDGGYALLVVIASGGARAGRSIEELVAEVMSGAGWRDPDDRPISPGMARQAARPTDVVLRQLCPSPLVTPGRTVTPELAEFARLALIRGG